MRQVMGRVGTVLGVLGIGLVGLAPPAPAATVAGEVLTFGGDSFGQLGNGTAGSHFTRTGPVLSGASDVAGGREHVLALVGSTVYAWGSDQQGQVGNRTPYANVTAPVSVLTGARAVTTGHYHSLVLMLDGSVRAWGWNNRGQTGPAGGTSTRVAAPVAVSTAAFPSAVVQVAAGRAHSMVLLADGSVWTWGDNTFGQLGYGTADANRHANPQRVVGLPGGIAHVAGGRDSTYAVTATGEVWAWGSSQYGQVGNGTVGTNVRTPAMVLTGVKLVESGADHTIAVQTDGDVYTWGRNRFGQLGVSGTQNRSRPVQVTIAATDKVFVGRDHNIAIATDGRVFTWGRNDGGQLGLPLTVASSNTPRLLDDLTGARDAGGGQVYSVVLG